MRSTIARGMICKGMIPIPKPTEVTVCASKERGSMGYIVGYALVGAFLLGVLVGFGVSRFIDKE